MTNSFRLLVEKMKAIPNRSKLKRSHF